MVPGVGLVKAKHTGAYLGAFGVGFFALFADRNRRSRSVIGMPEPSRALAIWRDLVVAVVDCTPRRFGDGARPHLCSPVDKEAGNNNAACDKDWHDEWHRHVCSVCLVVCQL